MKLSEYQLGNLINIKHGYAYSGDYITQEDNGIVLVTPGNFRIGGGFQEEKCKFYKGDLPEEYILKTGDFIVTMTDLSKNTDTLGYSAFVPNSIRTYLHNQRIGLVSMISEDCDRLYLYWLMRTHKYQRTIANAATGATVKHTSPSKIYEYKFLAPKIDAQRKIANILSAYDDLIENNQKQIKLLEEAAMRLYKEWFVHLRFPGHETTKIVDGVPQGWEIATVKDMGKVITGKTPSTGKTDNYGNDIPFVKIPDMHGVVYPLKTEIKLSKKGADIQKNKYLPPKSIMVSCIATVGLVCIAFDRCQTNQQINSIVLNDEDNLYYLFFVMKEIKSLLEGVGSNGATMTNVNKTKFENIKLLFPDETVIKKFNVFAEPIFDYILNISKQNEQLIEARDKLLPKLMSGEIEV